MLAQSDPAKHHLSGLEHVRLCLFHLLLNPAFRCIIAFVFLLCKCLARNVLIPLHTLTSCPALLDRRSNETGEVSRPHGRVSAVGLGRSVVRRGDHLPPARVPEAAGGKPQPQPPLLGQDHHAIGGLLHRRVENTGDIAFASPNVPHSSLPPL